jgi:hypothetical protein
MPARAATVLLQGMRRGRHVRPRPESQQVQGGGLRGRLDLPSRYAAQHVQGGGLRGRLDLPSRYAAQHVQGGGLRGRLHLHPRPGAVLLRPVRWGGHVHPRPATRYVQGGVRRPGPVRPPEEQVQVQGLQGPRPGCGRGSERCGRERHRRPSQVQAGGGGGGGGAFVGFTRCVDKAARGAALPSVAPQTAEWPPAFA